MWRTLEKLYRWFQHVGRAGDEIDALKKRLNDIEAELKRRPGPDFCPMCAGVLRTKATEPIMHAMSDAQLGERRTMACDACAYERRVDVRWDD